MTAGSALLALLLMTAPSAPADQADFIADRGFNIPIKTDPGRRADIHSLQLYVSTDEGANWKQVGSVKGDATEFPFTAPSDGLYWFSIIMTDMQGGQSPDKPRPDLKLYVDTVKPQAVLNSAIRQGDEIVVSWNINEQFPSQDQSRLEYRTENMPKNVWNPASVLIDPASGRAGFKPGNDYAMSLRLHIEDRAGNAVETSSVDVPGSTPPNQNTLAMSGQVMPSPAPTPTPFQPQVQPLPSPVQPAIQPAVAPANEKAWSPQPPPQFALTAQGGTTTPQPSHGTNVGTNKIPIATTASNKPEPAPLYQVSTYPPKEANPTPPAPASPLSLPAVTPTNTQQVTFDFSISQIGSSGVSEVLVYITQDDGLTWQPWPNVRNANPLTPADEAKPQTGMSMRKSLQVDLPGEGVFGLYLIAKSGIGRSLPPPGPRTAPHLRYEVDLKTPEAVLYSPEPEPGRSDTLIFTWEARDRNLAEKPILLEWSQNHDGPWQAISTDLPNVPGRFVWKMPPTLPAEVYLKMTVRDRAGNFGIAQTDQPIQVDLNVPIIGFDQPKAKSR